MEKIRDLFKKIKETKGTFHAKMGSIKGRNKNTQKNCTKMIFTTQIIMMGDHSPRARHSGM